MPFEKKEIHMKSATSLLEKLNKDSEEDSVVSLGKFIAGNFEYLGALSRSGKSVKQIYECLRMNGHDVGSYHSFRSACYRAGLRQRTPKALKAAKDVSKDVKAQLPRKPEMSREPQKAWNAKESENRKGRISKYYPTLPPIILPGGVEAFIDPESGAKLFEITSGKE